MPTLLTIPMLSKWFQGGDKRLARGFEGFENDLYQFSQASTALASSQRCSRLCNHKKAEENCGILLANFTGKIAET